MATESQNRALFPIVLHAIWVGVMIGAMSVVYALAYLRGSWPEGHPYIGIVAAVFSALILSHATRVHTNRRLFLILSTSLLLYLVIILLMVLRAITHEPIAAAI